jgi:FkbM family methyltransferase
MTSNYKRSALNVANRWLSRLGLHLAHTSELSLEAALRRVARKSVPVSTVIDIGASDGRWTARVLPFYPQAQYCLLDANPVHEAALRTFTATRSNTQYVMTAAGDHVGEVYFDTSDDLGGVAQNHPVPGWTRIPVTTLDALVEAKHLLAPFLIKLDTHGHEVPILEGARQTLTQTSLIIMEAYNFPISPDCLRFYEICLYLRERGFLPVDMIDPLHRQRDGIFWQCDLVFMRAERPEFQHISYA